MRPTAADFADLITSSRLVASKEYTSSIWPLIRAIDAPMVFENSSGGLQAVETGANIAYAFTHEKD